MGFSSKKSGWEPEREPNMNNRSNVEYNSLYSFFIYASDLIPKNAILM